MDYSVEVDADSTGCLMALVSWRLEGCRADSCPTLRGTARRQPRVPSQTCRPPWIRNTVLNCPSRYRRRSPIKRVGTVVAQSPLVYSQSLHSCSFAHDTHSLLTPHPKATLVTLTTSDMTHLVPLSEKKLKNYSCSPPFLLSDSI